MRCGVERNKGRPPVGRPFYIPINPHLRGGPAEEIVAASADTGNFERTVPLKGNRLRDADLGCNKLTVFGTLRVIRHPTTFIGNKAFAPFTEIRLEE